MLGVTAASVVGLAMTCFSIAMAHIFYRSRRRRWQTVLAWLLCVAAVVTLGELLRPAVGNRSGQFSGFLAVPVYLYLFDVPVKQRLFTYFIVDTSMYLTALLSRYTVLLFHGFFPGFNPRAAFVALYFLLTGTVVFLFFRFLRAAFMERLAQFGEHLGALTAFACIGYVTLLLLFDAWQIRDSVPPGEYLVMLLFTALLACGYFLSFGTMAAVRRAALAQAQVRELTERARQSERYYAALAEHVQEVRRMRHDSLHHLRVLDGYARDGELGRLRDYIAAITNQMPCSGPVAYCANYAANILLSHYDAQARDAGASFRCDAQIPTELGCESVHLCTVLGNALQNALEACALQPPGQPRAISVLARMVGANLTLEFRNTYDGVALEDAGRLRSRKPEPGHGLGLLSIERVARQYHGYCSASRTETEFVLKVVLSPEPSPATPQKKPAASAP